MKIVSLCPSLTELVFDLGRGQELAGITRFCIHPAGGVSDLERVGGTKDPDVARIVELAPDLVLMNEEENRREDHEAFVRAGLACLNTFPKDSLETARMVRRIGAALEREDVADVIATEIEHRVARVCTEAEGAEEVRWAYLIWRKPWMTVNADTYSHSLLAQAGGVNVFGDWEKRYPLFELPDLVAAAPDVVLLGSEPFRFVEKHITELAEATGIDPARIQLADGEHLSWYGSRTPEGVDYAARLIRGVRRAKRK